MPKGIIFSFLVFHFLLGVAQAEECFEQFKKIYPPLVQQKTEYTCGAACVVSLVQHLRKKRISEEKIANIMGTNAIVGTLPEQMIHGLETFGVHAKIANQLSFNKLKRGLKAGKKYILLIQSDDDAHWVILADINGNQVTLMDPWNEYTDYQVLSRKEFLKAWDTVLASERKKHFGLEINP